MKETETEEVTHKKKETYYYCDKCHGHNHDKTSFKDDLNIVGFDASAGIDPIPRNTTDAHSSSLSRDRLEVRSKYEYLLCDECMERAHSYLKDFF